MATEEIQSVRRFNRCVTERIGALNGEYLARGRPLGASRLLWEIGNGDGDVRALRSRLGLDSGYVSRLLRSLQSEGLVEVVPSPDDRRKRIATLTDAGCAEVGLLDAQSDELARSILAALNTEQRRRLVEAMTTVERLLSAGLVEIDVEDPASADAESCIGRYFSELGDRFEHGFDPAMSISADVEELTEPNGLLLLARLHGEPVGCGALKFHDDQPTEIKRMWVSATTRGLGVGRNLLEVLEHHATKRGATMVRLETNRSLTEAIGLYRSSGYREVEAFNDETFAHHWFEKSLSSPPIGAT